MSFIKTEDQVPVHIKCFWLQSNFIIYDVWLLSLNLSQNVLIFFFKLHLKTLLPDLNPFLIHVWTNYLCISVNPFWFNWIENLKLYVLYLKFWFYYYLHANSSLSSPSSSSFIIFIINIICICFIIHFPFTFRPGEIWLWAMEQMRQMNVYPSQEWVSVWIWALKYGPHCM